MTAKYPVETSDQEGIVDAVNYLLSGPAGLGQNFSGFSSFTPAWVRATNLQPFTLPTTTTLFTNWNFAWTITNITVVGGNPSQFIEVTFTPSVTLTAPPFEYGDKLLVTGVTPSFYDDRYTVLSSTTTTVILFTTKDYTWPAYSSGGTVGRDRYDAVTSTDCNARVTVFGPTDQVFVSAQVLMDIYTEQLDPPGPPGPDVQGGFELLVQINRYEGFPTTNTNDNDFIFANPVTVSERSLFISYLGQPGQTRIFGNEDFIFTTVLDRPNFGYYWYILEINPKLTNTSSGAVAAVSIASGTGAGVPATYTNVAAAGGTGTACTLDVVLTAATSEPYTDANTTITVNTGGTFYDIGETLTVSGADLGGATPANDLVVTITECSGYGNFYPENFKVKLRSLTAQVIKQ